MIDTVVLSIPCNRADFGQENIFADSIEGIWEPPYRRLPNGFFKTTRNPSSIERQLSIYVPRLTLIKRIRNGFHTELRIEFSIPKLLFNNNFQEVTDVMFDELVDALHQKLAKMQVNISRERINNARVSSIHYAKNLILPRGMPSSIVLNRLSKAVDCNQRLDIKNVSYKNGGQIIHIHANHWEFVIYDKVKELQKAKMSERKSIEKDSYVQYNFLESESPLIEVTRLEFRLGNRNSIRQMLRKYCSSDKVSDELSFRGLYSYNLSRKLVQGYWQELKRRYQNISWREESNVEFFTRLKYENPTLSESELINTFFLNTMIREEGIASLRTMMGWQGKERAYKWSRRRKLLERVKHSEGIEKDFILRELDRQITEYQMIRTSFEDLTLANQSELINNDK